MVPDGQKVQTEWTDGRRQNYFVGDNKLELLDEMLKV